MYFRRELMMNEEDEAFNEIERRSKVKQTLVKAQLDKPQRTWAGLTDEERTYLKDLEAFAKLVAAKEREAVAQMVEPWLLPEYVEKIRARGQA